MTARDPRTWDKSAQMVRALPWNIPSPSGSRSSPPTTCGSRTSPTPADSSASSRRCSPLSNSRSSTRPSHNGTRSSKVKCRNQVFQLSTSFQTKHNTTKFQIQIKFNFKIKTCLITKFSSEERKCDALPRYNNIAMLFHQDKIEDELADSKENIKDGGMTLDDDFSPFSGRAELSSYHTTCLQNLLFSFIIQYEI